MTKATNIKEHLQESDRVSKLIDDANALVKKLQSELAVSRSTLEALSEMQHPKLRMTAPYHLRDKANDAGCTPLDVINMQIRRISGLLGDRA